MAGTWIRALGEPFHRVKKTDAKTKDPAKDARRKQTGAVLCGVLAAAVMLMMIIPLLMSSRWIFSQIFNSIFRFFSPLNLLRKIDIGNIIGICLTFCFRHVRPVRVFAGLFKMNLGGKTQANPGKISPATGIAFAGMMAAVYVLYAGIRSCSFF